jgi:hypothetical protein
VADRASGCLLASPPELGTAAVCNDLSETGKITGGCANAASAPRRDQSVNRGALYCAPIGLQMYLLIGIATAFLFSNSLSEPREAE